MTSHQDINLEGLSGDQQEAQPPPPPIGPEHQPPPSQKQKPLQAFVTSSGFKRTIIACILLNFLLIFLVDEVPELEQYYLKADFVFLGIFVVEALLKMGAFGIGGYFSRISYRADFILLLLEVIECFWSLAINSTKIGPVGFLRLGRPLRVAYKLQNINSILKSVWKSLPTMGGIFLIFLVLICFCAGIMTQILMGDLQKECLRTNGYFMKLNDTIIRHRCKEDYTCEAIDDAFNLSGKYKCLQSDMNPQNGTNSFDDFFHSLLNLFMIITLDNWSTRMVDVREAEGHVYFDVLFIGCILVFALALLNTVVAVQIQFMEEEIFRARLDENIAEFLEQLVSNRPVHDDFVTINRSEAIQPTIQRNQARERRCCTCLRESWASVSSLVRQICDYKYFDLVMIIISLLYLVGVVSMEGKDHHDYDNYLYIMDVVFIAISTFEVIIKWMAYGQKYFFNIFNWIDFGVFIITWIEIFEVNLFDISPAYGRLIRSLRVFQVFKEWESARVIFMSLIDSLTLIINFSILILIYLYVTAAIGNILFSDVEFGGMSTGPEPYGFQTVHQGLITSLILLTGSNWTVITGEVMRQHSGWAAVYFVCHMLIGHLMLMNIYVAILVKVNQMESLFDTFVKRHNRENRRDNDAVELENRREPESPDPLVQRGQPGNNFVHNEQVIFEPESQSSAPIIQLWQKAERRLRNMLSSEYFENLILCVLVLNTLLLQIDDEAHQQAFEEDIILEVSLGVAWIFTVECAIKLLVFRGDYFKSKWNWLDFAVAVLCIPEVIPGAEQYMFNHSSTKVLRSFRILRIGSSSEGIRTIVLSLFRALSSLGHVLFVYVIVIVLYAIIGVVAFSDLDNSVHSFSSFLDSLRAFFDISTLNNWELLMEEAAQVTSTPFAYFVFVSYILFVTFYILKLFVSTIMDSFSQEMQKELGTSDLQAWQKEWIRMTRQLALANPKIVKQRPQKEGNEAGCFQRVRCFLFDIITSEQFEKGLAIMIILNTLCELLDHADQKPGFKEFFIWERLIFKWAYTLEMFSKLTALGPTQFFSQGQNRFDVFLLSAKWYNELGKVINVYKIDPTVLRFFRLNRLGRKYFKIFPQIQGLIDVFSIAASNLFNTCLVLLGTIFIFTILAVNLFHDIEKAEMDDPNYIYMINKEFNFDSFYMAYVTLFRIATVDSWIFIAHQIGFQGNIFFIIYIVIVFLILENLFIAVVWEVFIEVKEHTQEFEHLKVKHEDLDLFREAWSMHDPIGDLYIQTSNFHSFLFSVANKYKSEAYIEKVSTPWFLEGIDTSKENCPLFPAIADGILETLNLCDHNGEIYFPEVLFAFFFQMEFGTPENKDDRKAPKDYRLAEHQDDRMEEIKDDGLEQSKDDRLTENQESTLWTSAPIMQSVEKVRRKYSGFRKALTYRKLCSLDLSLSDKKAIAALTEYRERARRSEVQTVNTEGND